MTRPRTVRTSRRRRRRTRQRLPPLRLTPYAWAKLLFLRDLGETEVGGFGVSRPGDLLLVEDVHLVQQVCTPVTVKFDDQSVADYFDDQVDQGRTPEAFARIWIHTHPGDSPYPSAIDEETFDRCFGSADWSLMLIVARGGQAYARLQMSTGPGGELILPVEIDFEAPVDLFKAMSVASVPPSEQIRLSPSTRGRSTYP
jgi:proteasome lid subunit RPN8/RPN11